MAESLAARIARLGLLVLATSMAVLIVWLFYELAGLAAPLSVWLLEVVSRLRKVDSGCC